MLLSKKELLEIAEPRENDEVHQSKLLDSSNLKYSYKILLKKNNFTVKPGINFVVISTNEDRNPVYRFRFSWKELMNLFEYSDYITFLIENNIPKLYVPREEPKSIIKEYLY